MANDVVMSIQVPNSILHWIAVIILYGLCIVHFCKTRSDLHTEEREAIKSPNKPELTLPYKLVQYFTSLSILLITFALTGFAFDVSFPKSYSSCTIIELISTWSLHLGQLLMYWVFLLRLEIIYAKSDFKYSRRTLMIYVLFTLIVTGYLIIREGIQWELDTKEQKFFLYDPDEKNYPVYCIAVGPRGLFIIYLLFDLIMNVAYCVMYIIPLRKTIKLVADPESKNLIGREQSERILSFGYKIAILTFVLCVSTIVTYLLFAITGVIILPIDSVINTVCLMLMTPYYPDSVYKTLCFLCIACCDPNNHSTEEKDVADNIGSIGSKSQTDNEDDNDLQQ